MIYPASYDITILQDATWRAALRVSQRQQQLSGIDTTGSSPLFQCPCHDLEASSRVVFAPVPSSTNCYLSLSAVTPARLPCGIATNTVYYVASSGLTDNGFYVSATAGGSPIAASGVTTGAFYVAEPVNLTGYGVDADLNVLNTTTQVATFACALTDAQNGLITVSMAPAVSSGLTVGDYGYDVSITAPSGDRYYVMQGTATVQRTYSRT